ncbi:MAG: ribosome assembly cofactor RimP [Candidatus Amulumruptor caecigallinarius]|nr:ribosome assembly cofactor RimP [Candidatus Amulumruptor caecigallinarius]
MIDKESLRKFIEERLAGTEYFLVELNVSTGNEIKVEIDSASNPDLEFCISLSKEIEEAFPREEEDYELEVGSSGFTAPFKVRQQYEKNIGNPVELLTRDGRKIFGTLRTVGPETFGLDVTRKVKEEGAKRPVDRTEREDFRYNEVKTIRYDFKF